MYFVENTCLGLSEDADSVGSLWRNALVERDITSLKKKVKSDRFGGPEELMRHYEVNLKKDKGLGSRTKGSLVLLFRIP